MFTDMLILYGFSRFLELFFSKIKYTKMRSLKLYGKLLLNQFIIKSIFC